MSRLSGFDYDSVTEMYLSSIPSPSSPHFAQSPFKDDADATPTTTTFSFSPLASPNPAFQRSPSAADIYASSSMQSPTFGNNFIHPFTIARSTSISGSKIHKRNASNASRVWISSRPSLDHTNMSGLMRLSMDTAELKSLEQIANLRIEDSPLTPALTPSSSVSDAKKRGSFRNVLGSPSSPSPKRASSGFANLAAAADRRSSITASAMARQNSLVGMSNVNRRHSRQMSRALAAPPPPRRAVGLDPKGVLERIANGGLRGLMIVDVRPVATYMDDGRLKGSLNANFPTLLLKRYRRGHHSSFSLESFITTDAGRATFHRCLTGSKSGTLGDLDVLVVDDEISELEVRGTTSLNPGCVLLSVLEKLSNDESNRSTGELYFLAGKFSDLQALDSQKAFVVASESDDPSSSPVEMPTPQPSSGSKPTPPSLTLSRPSISENDPPSNTPRTTVLHPPNTPRALPILNTSRRPKQLELKLDTSVGGHKQRAPPSALPLNTPLKTNFGAPPKTPRAAPPPLKLLTTSHAHEPNSHSNLATGAPLRDPSDYASSPHPGAGRDADTPISPAPSTNPDVTFSVSTIIPGFLYLGPEPTCMPDVNVLKDLGVKRILNMALECPILPQEWRDAGGIKEYKRIGMKDFVEEVGVQGRMDEACKLMDDAQLRDEPVYVHCKAGRSRSVTMVLAFLIHRNNWPLKKAYAHVSERRPGISPNIGFVSELMKFEERTISSTRQTIENVASTYHATNPDLKAPERPPFNAFYSAPLPRTQRDSMPPPASSSLKPGPGWRGEMRKGDGSWAVEGRDMDLPRRASKAGLESSF